MGLYLLGRQLDHCPKQLKDNWSFAELYFLFAELNYRVWNKCSNHLDFANKCYTDNWLTNVPSLCSPVGHLTEPWQYISLGVQRVTRKNKWNSGKLPQSIFGNKSLLPLSLFRPEHTVTQVPRFCNLRVILSISSNTVSLLINNAH